LQQPWRGRIKLVKMAKLAIEECLDDIPRADWPQIPLLLCIAEPERPGRLDGLDSELFGEIQSQVGVEFAQHSMVIPHGRVSGATALLQARKLIAEGAASLVLIAATDSFLTWPTLRAYELQQRLLTPGNSNGFIAGEGAAALLVGIDAAQDALQLCGLGFAKESATIDTEQPLRGEGLALAIRHALADAGCELHDLDYRITDLSGEQYYFKETALALLRLLRVRRAQLDVWHPAECIGETGSVSGVATLVVADAACRKAYAPGAGALCHAGNDGGQRIAAILRYPVG